MKNLAKVLTLILAVTLLATGCNLLNKEEPTTPPQEINADNVLDQQIYQRAVSTNDVKACETIKDESVKSECSDTVDALILIEKAVTALDDDICGDIKLDRYEDECKSQVAALIAKQKEEENKKQLLINLEKDRSEIAKDAYAKQDFTICDKMQDQNQRYTCRFNILLDVAKSKQDISYCDKIGKIDYIQECKSIINDKEF